MSRVFFAPKVASVLTEDAEQTLHALIESTRNLIDGASQIRLELWNWRKANPSTHEQPAEQRCEGRRPHQAHWVRTRLIRVQPLERVTGYGRPDNFQTRRLRAACGQPAPSSG
jgi:hypothetical protein